MFSYIIELTMIFLFSRAIMFIDSVPQGEAMNESWWKENWTADQKTQVLVPDIFRAFIWSQNSILRSPSLDSAKVSLYGKMSTPWYWTKRVTQENTEESPRDVHMGKPATFQTRSDSSHQKRLRPSHKHKTRMWILSENRAFKWTYWTEVLGRN